MAVFYGYQNGKLTVFFIVTLNLRDVYDKLWTSYIHKFVSNFDTAWYLENNAEITHDQSILTFWHCIYVIVYFIICETTAGQLLKILDQWPILISLWCREQLLEYF